MGVFHISKVIKLFSQRSCQVVYYRASKLPGTKNTFNRSFLKTKLLDFCEMSINGF